MDSKLMNTSSIVNARLNKKMDDFQISKTKNLSESTSASKISNNQSIYNNENNTTTNINEKLNFTEIGRNKFKDKSLEVIKKEALLDRKMVKSKENASVKEIDNILNIKDKDVTLSPVTKEINLEDNFEDIDLDALISSSSKSSKLYKNLINTSESKKNTNEDNIKPFKLCKDLEENKAGTILNLKDNKFKRKIKGSNNNPKIEEIYSNNLKNIKQDDKSNSVSPSLNIQKIEEEILELDNFNAFNTIQDFTENEQETEVKKSDKLQDIIKEKTNKLNLNLYKEEILHLKPEKPKHLFNIENLHYNISKPVNSLSIEDRNMNTLSIKAEATQKISTVKPKENFDDLTDKSLPVWSNRRKEKQINITNNSKNEAISNTIGTTVYKDVNNKSKKTIVDKLVVEHGNEWSLEFKIYSEK